MKVYIDSNLVLNPTDSLLKPKFTIRRKNENGDFSVSFTGELNFIGDDYTYIYNKLVLGVGAINESVELRFVDDCCGNKEYLFVIKPESLKWCENSCELSANAVEFTIDSKAYTCLENTLIWDNYANFKTTTHPRMKYCLEFRPSLLQDIMLIVGLFTVFGATTILSMFATILLPAIGIINSIVNFCNSTFSTSFNVITIGGFSDPIDIFNFVKNLFEDTNGLISGCGHEHPSPLVRSYLDNVCNKCGIPWNSSIFKESNASKPNNDYYNLVYFSAPIKSGRDGLPYFGKPLVPFIEDNQPIHNGKSFIDEIVQPFNARGVVSGGVLTIERRDFFVASAPWFDITSYDKDSIIKECFEWSKKRRPAYANFQYTRDAVDWCGAEANSRWSAIVEWNSPVNPIQKGEFTKLFPYSSARFREDGIERDVLSDYDWMPYGIGQSIRDNDKAMIMNSGTSFVPKLLIWDGQDIFKGMVRRNWSPPGVASNEAVNYPMWVDETKPGNLYDRFWSIEDPRNTTFSGFDFSIEITWDCVTLNAINIDGTIMTSRGISKEIYSIGLDFTTNTMTINGRI